MLSERWLECHFPDCTLAISARRLWEHGELGQINPFGPITSTSAARPQQFVDVIDVANEFPILTSFTLADLLADEAGLEGAKQLLQLCHMAKTTRWLQSVRDWLILYRRRISPRNVPEPFLPTSGSRLLQIEGLNCGLDAWLVTRSKEKALATQWRNRIGNLAAKGLRADEASVSHVFDHLAVRTGEILSGNQVRQLLDYRTVRLSILPVTTTTDSQLTLVDVPATASVKRMKPKLPGRPTMHPRWRDPALGYWIDRVEWNDLFGSQHGWVVLTHRGQPLAGKKNSQSPFCSTPGEAKSLAHDHAKSVFPKLTAKGDWAEHRLTGGEHYREWLVTLPYFPASFQSSHFEHRNVLLHIRCDLREDLHGNRVLLLQEVQSDWAQQARRNGQSASEVLDDVPPPPWLQEWPSLALKLTLLHAVHLGAAALAWTPGSIQAARYAGIGGAGLTELYDRTLPREMNRLLYQYGKQCEIIPVFIPTNFFIEPADVGYDALDKNRDYLGTAVSHGEALMLLPDGAQEVLTDMHGVTLDDELRSSILADGFQAWGSGIAS